jgi:aerobic carbon-monoxide dehydrogenase medium subunit
MKWPAFAYARAATLDELWTIRRDAGPDAKVIAGGQSLLASLAFRLSAPSALIDISGIADLQGIKAVNGALRIGALTTHAMLGASAEVASFAPLIAAAVPLIAHPAIRNRGTIGGNLAYADPASELPACLVALNADVLAASPRGERRIPAGRFFTGLFETALAEDEIITAIEAPRQGTGERSAIDEVARRSGDYAMAGLACSLRVEGNAIMAARLVYFGVGEGPVLARTASAALASDGPDAALAALDADLDPTGDQHASPAMKRHLAKVLTRRVVQQLMAPKAVAA